MSWPRLVATDLDGTLLRSDGTVSARTARTLRRLDAAGVPVVFVTGRPIRWLDAVRPHVGLQALAIGSNGAVVVDLATDRLETVRPLPLAEALRAVAAVRTAVPAARFAVEDLDGFGMEPDYPARWRRPAGTLVAPAERLLDRADLLKLLVRAEGADPDALHAAVTAAVAGRVEATLTGAAPVIEISGAGVTKATTLALLCERLGVAREDVVAFGDMPNDRAVLQWAGRSFAMAGAHASLDAVVTDRAGGNDEDGVAAALERLFELD